MARASLALYRNERALRGGDPVHTVRDQRRRLGGSLRPLRLRGAVLLHRHSPPQMHRQRTRPRDLPRRRPGSLRHRRPCLHIGNQTPPPSLELCATKLTRLLPLSSPTQIVLYVELYVSTPSDQLQRPLRINKRSNRSRSVMGTSSPSTAAQSCLPDFVLPGLLRGIHNSRERQPVLSVPPRPPGPGRLPPQRPADLRHYDHPRSPPHHLAP